MFVTYRACVLIGLLTVALAACGDESGAGDESSSDEAPDDESLADDDEDAPAGSVRDGGAATSRDAGQVDASKADAGRTSEGRADGGAPASPPPDAGAQLADASAPVDPAVCPETAGWTAQASAFEEQVLVLTNEARAKGHNCDTRGNFAATGPLKMEAKLRCAARLHSKYMADTGEFSHDQSATGKDLSARIREAGYRASTWGENIAWGQRTAAEVVQGWLDSDGHCANIMSPAFKEIGIGYVLGTMGTRPSPYWTQDFGASR